MGHVTNRFETLADRVWDPTSPLACEAAEMIRYAGKLQRLHEQSLCTKVRRAVGALVNWFRLR